MSLRSTSRRPRRSASTCHRACSAAPAQQAATPVIGFLSSRSAEDSERVVAAFRQGLAEAGYVEGRDVAIEIRWAQGQFDRLPALAAELVARPVDVLAAVAGNQAP